MHFYMSFENVTREQIGISACWICMNLADRGLDQYTFGASIPYPFWPHEYHPHLYTYALVVSHNMIEHKKVILKCGHINTIYTALQKTQA